MFSIWLDWIACRCHVADEIMKNVNNSTKLHLFRTSISIISQKKDILLNAEYWMRGDESVWQSLVNQIPPRNRLYCLSLYNYVLFYFHFFSLWSDLTYIWEIFWKTATHMPDPTRPGQHNTTVRRPRKMRAAKERVDSDTEPSQTNVHFKGVIIQRQYQ